MDRFVAMQTFVQVVDAGSFSAVARQLGSTQSAISKQVLALERHVKTKLLSRTTRSISITDEGQRYYETARRIVADVEEAEAQLKRGNERLAGRLRVGASSGFGRFVLFPIVCEFMASHPEIEIDLQLNDRFVDVVAEGLDVVLRVGELNDSSLHAVRVGTADRSVVAEKKLAARLNRAHRLPSKPQDLAASDCVIYTGLATPNIWTFDAPSPKNEPLRVRVQGRFSTSSTDLVRDAVLRGIGIGFAPNWFFRDELASGKVVRLLPKHMPRPLPVHALYPASRKHSQRLATFIAFAKSKVGHLV